MASDGAADEAEEDPDQVVLIGGTRSAQMAGAVHVIGEKQLERTEYDDPHAVLRQVPGVFVRDEDGTGLRPNIAMRGANPDRSKKVTLMEDGLLFGPAPYSAPAAYYFPLMTRMSQVRVIKGPGAVAFGPQTVGGAVDLISRRIPTSPEAALDLALGEYNYRKAHAYAGTSDEQWGVLFEGTVIANDGFKGLPSGFSTGSARQEWVAKGSYVLDPHAMTLHEFGIKLGYSAEASNETYLGITDEDFDADPNQRYAASALDRMDNHRTSVTMSHKLESLAGGYELVTSVYRHDFSRVWRKFNRLGGAAASSVLNNPEDPENASYFGVLSGQANSSGALDTLWIGPNARVFVSQGLSSRFRIKRNTGALSHKIEAGLRLHYDSIERDHSESAYLMVDQELIAADEATIVTTQNKGMSHAFSLHATDAVTYRALTLTPGVRLEIIGSQLDDYLAATSDQRAVAAVIPGIGAFYALGDDWGVLAGAYRGFSPPVPGSEKSTKPEYSVNYEIGTRYLKRPTKLELLGFLNDYSNLTDVCTFSSGCLNEDLDRQFDAGKAFIYGLEALAAHTVEAAQFKFPLQASYSLNYGHFRNSFESADPIYGSVEKGDELPYVARHQLSAQVAAQIKRWEAYVMGTYVSQVREQAGSEDFDQVISTDPLITFDVGVSAQLLSFMKIYVHARNLLDYQGIMAHRPFGARPNAPRWIQGGAKFEF